MLSVCARFHFFIMLSGLTNCCQHEVLLFLFFVVFFHLQTLLLGRTSVRNGVELLAALGSGMCRGVAHRNTNIMENSCEAAPPLLAGILGPVVMTSHCVHCQL